MKKPYILLMAATLATVAVLPVPRPAQADTASTLLIAGAAAMIVGALLVDSNNQPYYVSNGRHVYVSQSTAQYYHAHGNNGNHYGEYQHGQYHGQQVYGYQNGYQNTSQERYPEQHNNNNQQHNEQQHQNQDNHGYQGH